ncbi:MAG: hypothetical protein AB1791_15185 [Chloroflexota bacterium]
MNRKFVWLALIFLATLIVACSKKNGTEIPPTVLAEDEEMVVTEPGVVRQSDPPQRPDETGGFETGVARPAVAVIPGEDFSGGSAPERVPTEPTETPTPPSPPPPSPSLSEIPPAKDTAVVFLLDRSRSVQSYCDPEQLRLRDQIPQFLISLMSAYYYYDSSLPPIQLKFGVLAFPSSSPPPTQPPGTSEPPALLLRPLREYQRAVWPVDIESELADFVSDVGFTRPLDEALAALKQEPDSTEKVVVLVTDGIFKFRQTDDGETLRTDLQEKVQQIFDEVENVHVRVLLMPCPRAPRAPEYNSDMNAWFAVPAREGHFRLLHNDSTQESPLFDGSINSFLKALLSPGEPMTSLLRPGSPESRWGWLEEQESAPWSTPGDISRMNITLVTLGGTNFEVNSVNNNGTATLLGPMGDGLFPGEVFRYSDDGKAYGHCSPHQWSIKGPIPGQPFIAFYWWQATTPPFFVDSVQTDLETQYVVNNSNFKVFATVNNASSDFDSCYNVRLEVKDEDRNVIHSQEYDKVLANTSWEVNYRLFHGPQQLTVTVQIVREVIMQGQSRIVSESRPLSVEAAFEPELIEDSETVSTAACLGASEQNCIRLTFYLAYARKEFYAEGTNLGVDVFALSALDINSQSQLRGQFQGEEAQCRGPYATEEVTVPPNEPDLFASRLPREQGNNQAEVNLSPHWRLTYRQNTEQGGAEFTVILPEAWVEGCQYEKISIDWLADVGWSNVVCDIDQNRCWSSDFYSSQEE